ncbi:hypothetical protein GCM10023321_28030 [Pseudonocardia eucalypti]|uniref:HMA domain-containing protein n=2 Tax=Pseudonocardia eucalypti TaxID=648755 RepID=A0ABP9Q2Y4_9PSEU
MDITRLSYPHTDLNNPGRTSAPQEAQMAVQAPFRITVTVTGMSCDHCVGAVTEELRALSGVRSVDVTLGTGAVTITSDRELNGAEITGAVAEAGYALAD